MKTRSGFVSNSSSSSFVIKKDNLCFMQVLMITKYRKTIETLFEDEDFGYIDDFWEITEDDDEVRGSTSMDNFNIGLFLDKIGVKKEAIEWQY